MKIHATITISILATLALVGCIGPFLPDQPADEWEEIQINTVKDTVEEYMKLTLVHVPGDSNEYAKAKTMLTPNFAAEFTEPVFVPTSYCIQNNPDNVDVASVTFDDGWHRAEALVRAKYGDDSWKDMWLFTLVVSDGGEWLIESIECIYLLDEEYQNLINNL
ncbi:hypothetical protein KKF55_06105 [Patescibacteria group bacterium]|nr:hypothetical protein [Patescibacteria group bacterium]